MIAAAAADTVKARRHFFGAENVDASGRVRRDRVVLSWFSVASVAAAIDGRVVLLDTYIHKGENRPNYVPTTTNELVALAPEAIFIGHGHFDHANTGGEISARTGALVVGTPEHCDQAKEQAKAVAGPVKPVRCVAAVGRGSAPGAQVNRLTPLGDSVAVSAFKHLHSAAEAPDGENHETSLASTGLPDANQLLLHPPGGGTVAGLATSGDEGSSVLYQFRVGQFSLTWHDTVGPLRERAPAIFGLLRRLPPTDVELGSTLGFNDPTNGQRDPVDYMAALKPQFFYPLHHDFIAEYGLSKGLEGVFRREMAKRGPLPTEVRWLYDPFDYLRPKLMTFDVEAARFADPGACLSRRSSIGRGSIGRVRIGLTRRSLLRRAPAPRTRTSRSWRWCIKGSRGSVRAAFSPRGRVAPAGQHRPAPRQPGDSPRSGGGPPRARLSRPPGPWPRALHRGPAQHEDHRRARREGQVHGGRVRGAHRPSGDAAALPEAGRTALVRGRIATAAGLLCLLAAPAASADERDWARQALGLQYELASDVEFRNAPWVYTHNSYNSNAEMGTTLSTRDPNQSIAILDQLEEGVRSLEIDTHLFTSPQDPRVGARGPVVCHARGEDQGHAGCTTEKPLVVVLREVRDWLNRNPGQVLLLYLESHLESPEGYAAGAASIEEALGGRVYRPAGRGSSLRGRCRSS